MPGRDRRNFLFAEGISNCFKAECRSQILKKNQRFCQKNEAPATDTILDPLFPFKGWKTTKCLVEANVKNRSQFDPPVMFFDINYLYWTWENAFWPLLVPLTPGGCQVGYWGYRGSQGPKSASFFGALFWFQNVKFWIVWTEVIIFQVFGQKHPLIDQDWPWLHKTNQFQSFFRHSNQFWGCFFGNFEQFRAIYGQFWPQT